MNSSNEDALRKIGTAVKAKMSVYPLTA